MRVLALVRAPQNYVAQESSLVEVRRWNANQAESLVELLEPEDTVCHLAAFIPSDHRDPALAEQALKINGLASLAVARASAERQVDRLIYPSGNLYRPGARPVGEEGACVPSSWSPYYLTSKLVGEIFVNSVGCSSGLSVTVLRIASIYGPELTHGLIPTFASRLRRGEPIFVEDGGRYRVDLVHVADVASAFFLAAERAADGIFNIGSGEIHTTLEVAEQMANLLNADRHLIKVAPPASDRMASSFAALDIGRARRILGYKPMSLTQGLERYLAATG
jgi:UDP-glucose 4-epimerase